MRRVIPSALAGLCVLAFALPASARKPEDVFAGRVILSSKTFPREARSSRAYIAQLKKLSKDRFMEDEEKKQWKIFYAAFFKRPLNDLEVTLKFYDVTGGGQRMVESYEQFLDGRGQRAIIGKLKLRRGEGAYEANTKIMMVVENRGRILAKKYFYLIGKRKTYSGKVVFSEEETNGGDKEE